VKDFSFVYLFFILCSFLTSIKFYKTRLQTAVMRNARSHYKKMFINRNDFAFFNQAVNNTHMNIQVFG